MEEREEAKVGWKGPKHGEGKTRWKVQRKAATEKRRRVDSAGNAHEGTKRRGRAV
jgi:hypothetical protein